MRPTASRWFGYISKTSCRQAPGVNPLPVVRNVCYGHWQVASRPSLRIVACNQYHFRIEEAKYIFILFLTGASARVRACLVITCEREAAVAHLLRLNTFRPNNWHKREYSDFLQGAAKMWTLPRRLLKKCKEPTSPTQWQLKIQCTRRFLLYCGRQKTSTCLIAYLTV